jgi:predicted transposase YdaD
VQGAADVGTATNVLLGLRDSDQVAHALFEEVLGMEQSATYQAIVRRGREEGREEGRAEEARRILLLQGETKFGPPGAAVRASIENIRDLAQLEELGVRLMSAGSWHDLLPPPAQRRRNGRRRSRG